VSRLRGRELIRKELLFTVARFSGFALLVYAYMRFWDFLAMDYSYLPVRAESMEILTQGTLAYNFWTFEVFLGILIPLLILFNNKLRHQKAALIVAGFLMAFALIVNRWDTNLMGLLVPSAYTTAVMPQVDINYSPTWVEWATAGGILGYWLMAFSLGTKYLPVFKQEPEAEDEHVAAPAPAMAQA
jgi:Ni/Fe-hydrogenase subunit HybB-like protein